MRVRRPYAQLAHIIGREFRGRMLWVLMLACSVAVLEFLSVGGMFPLLSALIRPAVRGASSPIHSNIPGLTFLSGMSVMTLASILLAVLVIKPLVTGYALREGFRFCYDVQVAVSSRMVRALLSRDYAFFLQENTAVLLRDTTIEVIVFIGGVLIPLIQLVTQFVILITVVATVAWISPIAAGVAFGAVGGLTVGLYVFINGKVGRWGRLREARQADMNRLIHQAFAGIKTVKAMNVEQWYMTEFNGIAREYATLNTRYQSAAAIPPLAIELVLFGGGMSGLVYAAATGVDVVRLMPTVGVLVLAGYRILAATRSFFTQLVTIRYNWASVGVVERALERSSVCVSPEDVSVTSAAAPINSGGAAVDLVDVSFRYPTGADDVVKRVTLTVQPGEHVAIVGGSGSGKTTLIDLILGLLYPTDGCVRVDGERLTRDRAAAWRNKLAYVPQQVFLADVSVRRNIAFGVSEDQIDSTKLNRVIAQARLSAFVARLPDGLDTMVGENGARLSGGERQRIGIARALYREPTLLVLDEATSALDAITESDVNREVFEACDDVTVLIVAHRLTTVKSCSRLVLMNEGSIASDGTYDAVIAASQEFARMHAISFAQDGLSLVGDEVDSAT
ncbi:MAG: ABC transporter ATP-binding protein [Gemmatimonadaceae bacterium]